VRLLGPILIMRIGFVRYTARVLARHQPVNQWQAKRWRPILCGLPIVLLLAHNGDAGLKRSDALTLLKIKLAPLSEQSNNWMY